MTRVRIDVFYLSESVLTQSQEEKDKNGELYIEKRPTGKYLCFKNRSMQIELHLTKKMYKSLIRFSSGVRMEKYIDVDISKLNNQILPDEDAQDCDLSEGEFYYVKDRILNGENIVSHLPVVVNPPPRPIEKSAFVIQVFQYIPKDAVNGSI